MANMDLIMQLREEGLGVDGGTASAHKARTASGSGSDREALGGGSFVGGLRRVHLHKVGAQAQRDASGASDEGGSLFVGNSLAARVNPQNHEQAGGVGLGDELASLGEHGAFVFRAQVDGVAQAHHVHTVRAHVEHSLEVVQLRAVGIVLSGFHEVGLRIHLDQVVDLGIIGSIAGNEAALAGAHAAHAFAGDFEQMLGIEVGGVDAFAIEVAVEVLDLLVACEQHQTAGTARGGHVIVNVSLASVGAHVGGNLHLITGDFGHFVPPCEDTVCERHRSNRLVSFFAHDQPSLADAARLQGAFTETAVTPPRTARF